MSEAKLCGKTGFSIFWLWVISVERTQANCTVQGATYFLCAGCMGGGGTYLYRFMIVQFLTALSSIYYCNQSVSYTTGVIVCHNLCEPVCICVCFMYCLSLCGIVQFVSIIFFVVSAKFAQPREYCVALKYLLTLVQGNLNKTAILQGRAKLPSTSRLPDNPR